MTLEEIKFKTPEVKLKYLEAMKTRVTSKN